MALALEEANEPETSTTGKHDDWLWSFSRLAGCYTPSGRITKMPTEGSRFVCKCFGEMQALLLETRTMMGTQLLQSPVQKLVRPPHLKDAGRSFFVESPQTCISF